MPPRAAASIAAVLALAGLACPSRRPAEDTLRVCVPHQLSSLDPHARDLLSSFAILGNVYEGLVTRDLDMTIRPGLARRWTNPDPLTWMFELRSDARFHDGTLVEADDVVATFERILRRSDLEVGFYGQVIAEVKSIGRFTVQMRTHRPSTVLLSKLPFLVIVPRRLARATPRPAAGAGGSPAPGPASATGEPLTREAIGTGAYRLVERAPDHLVFERFDAYWGERPAFPRVVMRTGLSREDATRELAAGACDLACSSAGALDRLGASARSLEVRRRTSLFLRFLGFDVARESSPFVSGVAGNPFRSRAVRQAVSLALDRKALAASSTARGIPASQLVPPFVFGFTPKLPELLPDPERSRALLAEAGFASGFDVTLHARKAFAETATHVAERLQPVGIRVKVEALADAEYFELVKGRGASFFLSRWGCPTGDASDLFDSGLHSRDEARHYGSGNSGGLSDPELDRLIEESAQIADLPVRRLALEKLMQRAMDEVYWVPLVLDEDVYALRRGLSFTPRADSYLMLAEIRPSPRS